MCYRPHSANYAQGLAIKPEIQTFAFSIQTFSSDCSTKIIPTFPHQGQPSSWIDRPLEQVAPRSMIPVGSSLPLWIANRDRRLTAVATFDASTWKSLERAWLPIKLLAIEKDDANCSVFQIKAGTFLVKLRNVTKFNGKMWRYVKIQIFHLCHQDETTVYVI